MAVNLGAEAACSEAEFRLKFSDAVAHRPATGLSPRTVTVVAKWGSLRASWTVTLPGRALFFASRATTGANGEAARSRRSELCVTSKDWQPAPTRISRAAGLKGKQMMWVVHVREPAPDMPYWPGRRWLAALDAMSWPCMGFWLLNQVQGPARVVLPLTGIVLAAIGLARATTAIWANHRYRFTTGRVGRIVVILLVVGGVFKLATLWH